VNEVRGRPGWRYGLVIRGPGPSCRFALRGPHGLALECEAGPYELPETARLMGADPERSWLRVAHAAIDRLSAP
jgi:hypothetical protein